MICIRKKIENHKVFEDEVLLGKAIVFAVLVEEALKRLGWSRGIFCDVSQLMCRLWLHPCCIADSGSLLKPSSLAGSNTLKCVSNCAQWGCT